MQIRETWEPILAYTAGIYLLPPLIVALAGRLLREKLSERTRSRMDTFFAVWSAVIPCFAMIGFLVLVVVTNSKWLGVHIVVATLVALFAAFIVWAGGVESDGITGTFFDTLFVGLIFFGALMFLAEASVLSDQKKAEEAARDAKFTQSVSYYLDANDRTLDGDTHTYPISNIGVNAEGDAYVWVEKRSDGTLTTRKSVKKVTDGHWEVVVKDDLPATDTEARRPRKRVGTLLTGFNFLKATSDNPIVFSGSFDSMVVKTDTPLTSGEFRDSIIDSTGSDFSGVTGMFATLISGTIRTSGSFFLETIGIVGEVALDAVAGDSTSFVDARNGFITSEGTKWVDIAEKATGESNMDAWSVDMMGVLRAQIEEGEAPQFNTFCVNPANDAANCDCATWLFFRDAGSADARQVWVWRNAQIGNAVDPAVMEGMDVAAVERIWRDTMAGIWTD